MLGEASVRGEGKRPSREERAVDKKKTCTGSVRRGKGEEPEGRACQRGSGRVYTEGEGALNPKRWTVGGAPL